MTTPCEICGGAKFIRLPVRETARTFKPGNFSMVELRQDSGVRTFDCPACRGEAPVERVWTIGDQVPIPDRSIRDDRPESVKDWARETLAAKIGEHMLAGGFITFAETKGPDGSPALQARVGVVTTKWVQNHEVQMETQCKAWTLAVLADAQRRVKSYALGGGWNVEACKIALDTIRDAADELKSRKDIDA